MGGNDVFVGSMVCTSVGDTGVGVRVQANELMMHKIKIKGLRFINEKSSPGRVLYPNGWERNSPQEQINIPVKEGDICILWSRKAELMPSFAVAAQLVLFLCDKCFQEHDRGRPALRALKALEDVEQFLGCIVLMVTG